MVLNERINQLRNVDKLVDISKSTIQIDIMLTLNKSDGTSAEIAKDIGQRRKAVTDAMRKLRIKGLVDEVMDEEDGKTNKYQLTSAGTNCLTTLLEITGSGGDDRGGSSGRRGDVLGHAGSMLTENSPSTNQMAFRSAWGQSKDLCSFPMAAVLSELILLLGTSKGNVMDRRKIAKALGLGEQRTESYIEVYLNGSPKLFRKYTESSLSARILSRLGMTSKKMNTVYGLTNEGLQYFYKLPSYTKLKQSLVYKLLSKITGTSHPKSIFKRLTIMLCGGGIVSVLSLMMPWGFISSGILLFTTAFVGAIIMLDALLYNSI